MTPSRHLRGAVARLIGRPLVGALVPSWCLVVFVVVQLQPVFVVSEVRALVAESAWVGRLAVAALGVILSAGLGGGALGGVLEGRVLRALRRQPPGRSAWAGALLPWALLASAAGALVLPFLPGFTGLLVAASAVVGGAAVSLVAAARRGLAVALALLLWGALAVAQLHVVLALLVLSGLIFALPYAVEPWRQPRPVARPSWWKLPGRPRSPMEAVARRDMLALSRLVPDLWSAVLWPAPLLGGLVWLSLERGVAVDHGGAIAGGIALCLASLITGHVMASLRLVLGPQFDVLRFPLSPLERVVALSITLETVISPVTTAVFLACWRLDSSELAWLGLVAMALSSGAQALGCRAEAGLRPATVLSWQLWWALAVFFVLWFPWWTAAGVLGAMVVAGWTSAVWSLRATRRVHVARS